MFHFFKNVSSCRNLMTSFSNVAPRLLTSFAVKYLLSI
nr:MAG TPA: hypothetical protein [Caudoviricetes sp.]